MSKWVPCCAVLFLIAIAVSGCESMGQALAKTEKGMEKGTQTIEAQIEKWENDFKKGYEEAQQ